ncbi:hypothetical protein LTR62_002564 [Meristemomyces frigidus]|uniref:Uncharacterized protein n=1 Tax=Meristemomyces frigidus TaxID=1508187 RepID=A0AAN7TGQ5_9PEZI|nr:hypothetical protein LTR62_002564 [Meristemomyces frigidus]
MSGNPFRRQRLPDEVTHIDTNGDAREAIPTKTKKKKKGVIQTPPHSPEERRPSIPRRFSDGLNGSPPPPLRRLEDEDSDSTATTADSNLDQALFTARNSGPPPTSFGVQSSSRAPYNPFARTLATSEAVFGLYGGQELSSSRAESNGSSKRGPGIGKTALDVDVFKNILLTGSATPSPPNGGAGRQSQQDSTSNTETSSLSKQSIFDNMLEAHPESPRTSFDEHLDVEDDDDGDDEQSSLMGPVSSRPVAEGPPAPPKQKHGRAFPQTVSFADFDETIPDTALHIPLRLQNTPVSSGYLERPTLQRSPSDLNKPLPLPPAGRPSADEANSQAPTQASDHNLDMPVADEQPTQQARKAPPPPPTARRRGQPDVDGRVRSDSNLSKTSLAPSEPIVAPQDSSERTSLGPPPPPMARRAQAAPSSAIQTSPKPASPATTPQPTKAIPPPPPRRLGSQRGSSAVRTPSNASRSSIPRSDSLSGSPAPPAPPPRRTAGTRRDSTENGPPPNTMNNRRPSHETRRFSGQSFGSDRAPSLHSLQRVHEPDEETALSEAVESAKQADKDYLADLDAFQAEIEALRAQSARNG